MKQITKNLEPEAFIRWKASKQAEIARKLADGASGDAIFSLLPSSLPKKETEIDDIHSQFIKADLRKSLLEEQGYICCYCNRALNDNYRTITEHFEPKGLEKYKARVFDYDNLHACCDGGERDEIKPRQTYCTASKGNNDPHVPIAIYSPLEAACETSFTFDESGKIDTIDTNDASAKATIKMLGLNSKSLVLQREKAINTYIFEVWSEDMDTIDEFKRLHTKVAGKYQPFCTAIISVLKNFP